MHVGNWLIMTSFIRSKPEQTDQTGSLEEMKGYTNAGCWVPRGICLFDIILEQSFQVGMVSDYLQSKPPKEQFQWIKRAELMLLKM